MDGRDRFALVALDPEDEGEIVAVVRYEREEGTDGAAAMLEDRFQARGLGIGLKRHLIEAARERGIESLHGLVMRENTRLLRLLRSLDLPERWRWEDSVKHVKIDLRPEAAA